MVQSELPGNTTNVVRTYTLGRCVGTVFLNYSQISPNARITPE